MRTTNTYVQGNIEYMSNGLVFPSGKIETCESGGCPFLHGRRLDQLRWRLGGLGGRSRDRFWLWRCDLPWWCSWLRGPGAVGISGVLEFRQPLQPNLSKPFEYLFAKFVVDLFTLSASSWGVGPSGFGFGSELMVVVEIIGVATWGERGS